METIKERLEYLRDQLQAENLSYGELLELQSLAQHIEPGDVELLEAAGVPENQEEGVDLFEDYENIPLKVQAILDKYENDFTDGTYDGLLKAHNELWEIGYTFEYYLDGQAYDLRPIGTKGKVESGA